MPTQKHTSTRSRFLKPHYLLATVAVSYFVIAGVLIAPYAGVENDEALFATGIYEPTAMCDYVRVFGKNLITMLMPYVGGLKSWIYTPIFAVWEPSVYSLRLPVILGGALAVWLFGLYLRRIAGERAAAIGVVLLATDVCFLLTATFDWGPVVLQHVLLLGGIVCSLEFQRREDWRFLAAGFFLFGLAMWDKAIFVWMFSGLVIATAILYHREILRLVTPKRCAIALASFLLGAGPLVVYNLQNDFATFRGKGYSLKDLENKAYVMLRTTQGSAMHGFLVQYWPDPIETPPKTFIEKTSVRLSESTGRRTEGILPYGLLLAVLAGPLLWRHRNRKLLLFFPLAFAVSWCQLLFTDQAGGAVHHTILIVPHLHAFLAVVLAGVAERFGRISLVAAVLVVALVAGSNVLVTNEHLSGIIRLGPARMWSDAVFELGRYLREQKPGIVYAADWGMGDTLRLYLRDDTPIGNAVEPFDRQELDETQSKEIVKRINHPGSIFVNYTEGREFFPNAARLVLKRAEEVGFQRVPLRVIHDRRGRPIFELYRFAPTP